MGGADSTPGGQQVSPQPQRQEQQQQLPGEDALSVGLPQPSRVWQHAGLQVRHGLTWDGGGKTSLVTSRRAESLKKHPPVFPSTDVIRTSPMDSSAHMAPLLRSLLCPGTTTSSLFYHGIQNLCRSPVRLSTLDLLPPPFKLRAHGWSRSQRQGPGELWQYGRQESSSAPAEESNSRNLNPAKEFSIRIISVWGHVAQETECRLMTKYVHQCYQWGLLEVVTQP